ncbi:MAG: single-stranded-DNA-specific exonuclease RecJ [Candidatus Doudnabacteria bacterium]|nr:single-stranded-DNA-specific exonuclease RecJ [Candidatus Doudnabacteria bacterium]
MSKIWQVKPPIPPELSARLNDHSNLVKQLLYNRRFIDAASAGQFLNTAYENLHSPFLFQDMQKAVDRIWQGINNREKICIYGDYDADAVTANAVLQQTFKYLGVETSSYIPDRFTEGYGVNLEAMEKIRDQGVKIIITVDCGTNSCDAAEFCKNNGIDFIITDHHEIIGPTPEAYALINPKNSADKYPYHEIVGVGVAFKLACGILSDYKKVSGRLSSRPLSRDPDESSKLDSGYPRKHSDSGMTQKEYAGGFEKWLLDLVAIGTVADCHSLIGENRILVKFGLKVLAKTKWIGLKALMDAAKIDLSAKQPDTYTLGFIIAPRLNAAGRLEHAGVALDLLIETDAAAAKEKALRLEQINLRRQQLTASVISEAKEQVLRIQDRKILALMGDNWPKGVVGLVAGRLAEEYYKPVIVLEKTEEFCTGSARTVGDFNILEAIKHASAHTVKFGGHKQAAGLTIKVEEFENFYVKLLEYAEANVTEESSKKILELEAELLAADLTPNTYNQIASLEPFGVDNIKPKFLVSDMQIVSCRSVGQEGKHVQFQLAKEGRQIPGIAFNFSMLEKNIKVGDTVDVACELLLDGWNGRSQLKLRIIDMRAGAQLT